MSDNNSWEDYGCRRQRNYDNSRNAGNSVQFFGNAKGSNFDFAGIDNTPGCASCNIKLTLMKPENIFICRSCGYNLDKIAINNKNQSSNNNDSKSSTNNNNGSKSGSRIVTQAGQSTLSNTSGKKGVLLQKDIRSVGRHAKPFRSNRDPYDTPGSHPLDKELVQSGYQVKEVKDVSDSQWQNSVRNRPHPIGPPRNLDE